MSRSKWKRTFCAPYIVKQAATVTATITTSTSSSTRIPSSTNTSNITPSTAGTTKKTIQVWSRASTILPNFVGKVFHVHNGLKFIRLEVQPIMIGHKFGEFASTRKIPKHPKLKSQVRPTTSAKSTSTKK